MRPEAKIGVELLERSSELPTARDLHHLGRAVSPDRPKGFTIFSAQNYLS